MLSHRTDMTSNLVSSGINPSWGLYSKESSIGAGAPGLCFPSCAAAHTGVLILLKLGGSPSCDQFWMPASVGSPLALGAGLIFLPLIVWSNRSGGTILVVLVICSCFSAPIREKCWQFHLLRSFHKISLIGPSPSKGSCDRPRHFQFERNQKDHLHHWRPHIDFCSRRQDSLSVLFCIKNDRPVDAATPSHNPSVVELLLLVLCSTDDW